MHPLLSKALRALLERPQDERRIGPFVLVEQIGRGGFAPVWLAREVYAGTEIRTAAVIDPDGEVFYARFKETSFSDADAEKCMLDVFRSIHFEPLARNQTVTYPINFHP